MNNNKTKTNLEITSDIQKPIIKEVQKEAEKLVLDIVINSEKPLYEFVGKLLSFSVYDFDGDKEIKTYSLPSFYIGYVSSLPLHDSLADQKYDEAIEFINTHLRPTQKIEALAKKIQLVEIELNKAEKLDEDIEAGQKENL